MEQVSRLRSKLIRERMLREQADVLSDEDIDKVIGYISAGFSLQGPGGSGGLRIGPGGAKNSGVSVTRISRGFSKLVPKPVPISGDN
ncbi:hypothetical protein Ddc_17391 [Ditylenchus destructor]|nr:hypothetical protein Ddc_17391 [Ditylenchus destructor]